MEEVLEPASQDCTTAYCITWPLNAPHELGVKLTLQMRPQGSEQGSKTPKLPRGPQTLPQRDFFALLKVRNLFKQRLHSDLKSNQEAGQTAQWLLLLQRI